MMMKYVSMKKVTMEYVIKEYLAKLNHAIKRCRNGHRRRIVRRQKYFQLLESLLPLL